jgi:DNA-binding Xre family transcriptional regulator
MKEGGLGPAELKRAIDPLRSFTLQLDEEIEAYERMQRGSFEPVDNLAGLGRLLIAARIFRRISQRELAKTLGVHESQVSRDERNEYRSITVERANRILEVLRVQLTSEMRPVPDEETVHSRAS